MTGAAMSGEDDDPIVGWIEYELMGTIHIYASDPIAGEVANWTQDQLAEYFAQDAHECVDSTRFWWQTR